MLIPALAIQTSTNWWGSLTLAKWIQSGCKTSPSTKIGKANRRTIWFSSDFWCFFQNELWRSEQKSVWRSQPSSLQSERLQRRPQPKFAQALRLMLEPEKHEGWDGWWHRFPREDGFLVSGCRDGTMIPQNHPKAGIINGKTQWFGVLICLETFILWFNIRSYCIILGWSTLKPLLYHIPICLGWLSIIHFKLFHPSDGHPKASNFGRCFSGITTGMTTGRSLLWPGDARGYNPAMFFVAIHWEWPSADQGDVLKRVGLSVPGIAALRCRAKVRSSYRFWGFFGGELRQFFLGFNPCTPQPK